MLDIPPAKILVVDDELLNMEALCDTLRDEGYVTAGCPSGTQALAVLQTQQFDLLLTDLMMPGIDGIALFEAAMKIDPNLAGVVMTGHGTVETAIQAMKVGTMDYILKPFDLTIVLPVISRALAMRRLRLENSILLKQVQEHAAKLEAANKELESFSYSVSHDLQAPLRAICGFSNLLLEESGSHLSEREKHLLQKICSGGQHMSELIEGLLNFSRLERQQLAREPTDLNLLIKQVLDELFKEIEGRDVEIQVAEIPGCVGDRLLLKQVFFNLLANALKFTRGKKAIIEVGYQPEENVYFVRDNGAGFDMKYANKLFGAFQRLHNRDQFEGTGVGLFIVQRIVQRHGGRIWAEAETGKGAAFFFTLCR